LLGYNSENGNYKPLPFDFTRASNGTFVNKSGLIETAASGVPRIDFSNDAKGALLLEPQRSNFITYSEDFSFWTIGGSITITDNQIISPDGTLNAAILDFTSAVSGGNGVYRFTGDLTGSLSRSIYLKGAVGGETVDLSDPHMGGGSNITLTTEWQRFEYISTAENTNSGIWLKNSIGNVIHAWGAQLEESSYPTSYIPTQGSAVTRVADACNQTVPDGVIGQTEGVIFLDIKMPSVIQSNTTFSIGGGTSGEYAQLEIRSDLSINWRYRVGNGDYINANVGSYLGGDRLKLAFAYKNGDSILYKNGVSIATDTGSIVSNSWNNVDFSNYAGTGKLNADVNQTSLYNTRLSNSELAALTS